MYFDLLYNRTAHALLTLEDVHAARHTLQAGRSGNTRAEQTTLYVIYVHGLAQLGIHVYNGVFLIIVIGAVLGLEYDQMSCIQYGVLVATFTKSLEPYGAFCVTTVQVISNFS